MKRLSLIAGVVFLMVVVAALSASASQPGVQESRPGVVANSVSVLTPTAVPTCAPSWAVVSSPEVDGRGATLTSVDSVSSTDVWAVGYLFTDNPSQRRKPLEMRQASTTAEGERGGEGAGKSEPSQLNVPAVQTLIEHWDGAQWTIVPGQNVGNDDNNLLMVDAVSATDVWAVGYYVNAFGISQTLVEHFDGTAWSVVASPNTGGLLENRLLAVEAVSASDVWAVGSYYDENGVARTLIEHFDGTTWNIVASPNNGDETQNNALYDLAVVSSGDIWAAGYYVNINGFARSLLLRWNGTQWNLVASPGIGVYSNVLFTIDASSVTDVWAAGYYNTTNSGRRALTQHWDGTQWTVIATPADALEDAYSIETVSATDAWVVGRNGYYNSPTLITMHWNGTQWTPVRAANSQGYFTNTFYGVDVVGTNDVWAVGDSGDYYAPQPVIQHYSTACLTCPARFVDVPEGSTYYNSIQCLACQELVGGYPPPPPTPINTAEPYPTPAPTSTATPAVEFRPNASITRGQLAKIVSNSAGFNDDPGQPLFQDVEQYYYYSPFYVWINRLANRGIVVGYPCGGEGEPCGYNNLPYFRPNNNATRGQIAKVVSVAAGYTELHTEQAFTDVPTSHQFYQWIARLYSRGLVGGYPCGGPFEPCDSQNRPYFRVNSLATRGQVTKIVAKGFFPNCYVP